MDKVKLVLAAMKTHHFWVLCALAVLLGLVFWTAATANLGSRYGARERKLNGDFIAVRGIVSQPNPPNEKVIEAVRDRHSKLKDKVLEAWEILYKEQEQKNPWPKILGQEFLSKIKSLKPEEEIPPEYRELYADFIKDHFPTLLEKVDARRPKELEKGAAAKAPPPAPGAAASVPLPTAAKPTAADAKQPAAAEIVGTVDWNPADLERIKKRFEWGTRPTTLEVRLAQEDLWVYEALLRIIRNSNEGATTYYNAPVKRIEALEIGKDAADAWGKAEISVGKFAAEDEESGGVARVRGAPVRGATDEDSEAAPEGAAPGEAKAKLLLEKRYVNEKGSLLGAGSKQPFAEFKMMPIRMKLVMDQTKLPDLLVQCANSDMPVAVRQVRLKPGEGAPIDFGQMAASESAGTGLGGLVAPRAGRPVVDTSRGRSGTGAVAGATDQLGPLDLPVEVLGIIYIFIPPDRAKLGTGAAAEQPTTAPPPAAPPAGDQPSPPAPAAEEPGEDK